MRIAGYETFSLVNGEGVRFVVFVQGCNHHCYNCQNQHTWDYNGGYEMDEKALANLILKRITTHPYDGITISGGEPFDQQLECLKLLSFLPSDLNVWIYTGYEAKDIKNTVLFKRADAVVTGKYIDKKKCEGQYYGSSNQKILLKNKQKC